VTRTDDPQRFLDQAGSFLESDPVRHNIILSLLARRVTHPEPGRYWSAEIDGAVAGVAFQSPLHFNVSITPMVTEAVLGVVEEIVADGVRPPGVSGEAATAARFAGHWAECTRSPVLPRHGQRIYEVSDVAAPRTPGGAIRTATEADRELLLSWLEAFSTEIGEPFDQAVAMNLRLAGRTFSFWDDGGPVAFAGVSDPVAGVARIGPVYTPPEARGRGYASAMVAAMSRSARDRGLRCILYTDLENPTSNSIYRALGYRAVAEVLEYRFG
jgi:GNAT superfamily N-acetyltransferase